QAMRREKNRHLGMSERQPLQRSRDGFTHPPAVLPTLDEGFVHSPARFFGHSERTVDQSASDIFRRSAESRDFIIVNRTGSVHRNVSYHASLHQIDQERSNSGLHDVAAEHHDDAAFFP